MKYCNIHLLGVFFLSCALTACNVNVKAISEKIKPSKKPAPIEVKGILVKKSKEVRTTPFVGKIMPSQSSQISNPYGGKVEKIYVKEGSRVQKGEIIAVLSSKMITSAYEVAQSTYEQAQDGYDRMMMVYQDGGVTELKKKEVETQLRQAKATYASATDALEKCTIRAPYDGVIEKLFIQEGVEVVAIQPIVTILNIHQVEIHFPVPENEVSDIQLDQAAIIEVPAIHQNFTGKIIQKGVTAAPMSHTYNCIINPDQNNEELLPGMVCKVFIQEEEDGLIVIPMPSVMTDDKGQYVWTARDNKIIKSRIVIDGFATNGVVIKEGLDPGDFVITEGRRKISSGMNVQINIPSNED